MFSFRKGLVIVLTIILSLSLLALPSCKAPAEEKPIAITFATYLTPGYEDLMMAMQGFTDEVNEKGKGKVTVDFHHSATLLEVKECIPGLLEGTADIVALPTTFVTGTCPILGVLCLPLLYESVDHFIAATEMGSPLYNFLNEEAEEKNLYIIFGPGDMREILWLKKPARTPDDLKGLKIRTPGILQAKEVEQYGASAVTIPSADTYLALERGVCDGALNSSSSTYGRGFYEVITHGIFATVPFEFYGGNDLYFRADWFKELPADVRGLLLEAGRNYQITIGRETKRVCREVYDKKLQEAGVEYIYLTEEETQLFRDRMPPVYDWWCEEVGEERGRKAIELAQAAAEKL